MFRPRGNITKKKAIEFLTENGARLLKKNPNWDKISVIKDPNKPGFLFSVEAYKIDEEKERFELELGDLDLESFIKKHNFIPQLFPLEDDDKLVDFTKSFKHRKKFVNLKVNKYVEPAPLEEGDIDTEELESASPTILRMGGNLGPHGTLTGRRGAIGGFLEGVEKRSSTGNTEYEKCYVITAYHVLDQAEVGDTIFSPYKNQTVLGTLSWYQDDDIADIALIEVDASRVNPVSECGFSVKPKWKEPTRGQVKMCASEIQTRGTIKRSEIDSNFTILRKVPMGDDILSNVVRMRTFDDFARGSDSGSLVVNRKDEVIGLLVKDEGIVFSYFISINLLENELTSTHKNGETITINVKQFKQ